jgi:hypothetical protein
MKKYSEKIDEDSPGELSLGGKIWNIIARNAEFFAKNITMENGRPRLNFSARDIDKLAKESEEKDKAK